MNFGERWSDRHILLNQAAALVISSFCDVFLLTCVAFCLLDINHFNIFHLPTINQINRKHCSAFCWLFVYYESD
jgi:hypothetical protein